MPWWVPFTLETLRQLVFIDTILMGIAFSFVIQLVAMRDSRPVVTSNVVMFLSAALMFLVSATVGMYGILRLVAYQAGFEAGLRGELPDKPVEIPEPEWLQTAAGLATLMSLLGLIAFLVGVSILPYIHSKRFGVITSGVLAFVIILVIMMVTGWA